MAYRKTIRKSGGKNGGKKKAGLRKSGLRRSGLRRSGLRRSGLRRSGLRRSRRGGLKGGSPPSLPYERLDTVSDPYRAEL